MELLSKSEFLERREAGGRQVQPLSVLWRWVVGGMLGLALAALGCMIVRPTQAAAIFFAGCLPVTFVCSLLAVVHVNRRMPKDAVLHCSECAKNLDAYGTSIALASNRCGLCGGVVFAEDAPVNGESAEPALPETTPRLVKAEFRQRLQAFRRANIWLALKFLVFGTSLLGVCFGPQLIAISPRLNDLLGWLFCAGVLTVLIWLVRRQLRQRRVLGLYCPCCDAVIGFGGNMVNIALASGHCPRCGGKVFADETDHLGKGTGTSAPDILPITSRAEFNARYQAFLKLVKLNANAWIVAMFIVVGLLLLDPYLHRVLPEHATAVEVGFSALLLLPLLVAICWIHRRGRRSGLQCPACGKSVHAVGWRDVAMATGHCGFCGERVFSDAPAQR